MGCVPKVIKKKRRILEIFKSHQSEAEEADGPDECFTVDLSNEIESHSEEDSPDYNCSICDRICPSLDQLESHKKIHSVDKTSSLILTVERDIFNNILAADSDPVPDTPAKISESLLDNYDELLENLISSVSPDELLEKISITNEIPEDYSVIKQVSVADQEPTDDNKCSKSVFKAKSKGQKRTAADEKEENWNETKRLKSKSERFSVEEVEFQNSLNGKIFNVLSKDSRGFSHREVETESLRFSLTTPLLPSPSPTPDQTITRPAKTHPHPQRTYPAVRSRSNKSFSARLETGERLYQAVRGGKAVFRNIKKKKNLMRRGTVGYLLKMESHYCNIEEQQEDVLEKSGISSPERVEPSRHQAPSLSLISDTTTETEVEMPPEVSAPEEPEVLPSMPVFTI